MSNEYFPIKDKTQQLLSYPLHFDPRVACCRCVSMIVTAFSSLPLVAVVVVMLLLSCCAGIRVYPAPQITVARVTVTSARCCTQNLESTGQGSPTTGPLYAPRQERRRRTWGTRRPGYHRRRWGNMKVSSTVRQILEAIRKQREIESWILNLEHVNASLAPFKLVQKL